MVLFTVIYNLPKFNELRVHREPIGNVSMDESGSHNGSTYYEYSVEIKPTTMRTNELYIRIYIFWMNVIVNLILPFVLLIVLNFRTYKKIKEFEKALSSAHIRVCFYKNSKGTNIRRNDGPEIHSDERERDSTSKTEEFQQELDTILPQQKEPPLPKYRTYLLKKLSGKRYPTALNARKLSVESPPHASWAEEIPTSPDVIASCTVDVTVTQNEEGTTTNTRPATQGTNQAESLRKREVALAKISLYIVFVFLVCHSVRMFPNTFEMVQTHLAENDHGDFPWPAWVECISNVSHLLLTVTSSANFYIYFGKHGQFFWRSKCNRNRRLRKDTADKNPTLFTHM